MFSLIFKTSLFLTVLGFSGFASGAEVYCHENYTACSTSNRIFKHTVSSCGDYIACANAAEATTELARRLSDSAKSATNARDAERFANNTEKARNATNIAVEQLKRLAREAQSGPAGQAEEINQALKTSRDHQKNANDYVNTATISVNLAPANEDTTTTGAGAGDGDTTGTATGENGNNGDTSSVANSNCKELEKWTINTDYLPGIKDYCSSEKVSATECCSNPNSCEGFETTVAKTALPIAPVFYGVYKEYKVSKDVDKRELTRQEAARKLCNSRNKVAMGSFLGNLLNQLGTVVQTTCRDKIDTCSQNCNAKIDSFKQAFRQCSNSIPAFKDKEIQTVVDTLLKCATIENDIKQFGEIKDSLTEDFKTCSDLQDSNGVNQKNINTAFKLLKYAYAYYHSSDIDSKNPKLANSSNEKEIVNCSEQKDRVATESPNPGGPVPPPMIQICADALAGLPPIPPQPEQEVPSAHASVTGNNDRPILFNDGGDDGYGVIDDDDLPPPNNRPPLTNKVARFGPNSSGAGAGGGGSAGGGLSGNSDSPSGAGGFGYSPYPSGIGGDFSGSFGGNDNYSRSLSPLDSDHPHRQAASSSDPSGSGGDMGFNSGDELSEKSGTSIFQIASQRIQQFCSDHECKE